MLVNSAIKLENGFIYIGKRHCDILISNISVDFTNSIQGFVTESGKFLDRKQAYNEAVKCNQIKHGKMISKILTSEDLW